MVYGSLFGSPVASKYLPLRKKSFSPYSTYFVSYFGNNVDLFVILINRPSFNKWSISNSYTRHHRIQMNPFLTIHERIKNKKTHHPFTKDEKGMIPCYHLSLQVKTLVHS